MNKILLIIVCALALAVVTGCEQLLGVMAPEVAFINDSDFSKEVRLESVDGIPVGNVVFVPSRSIAWDNFPAQARYIVYTHRPGIDQANVWTKVGALDVPNIPDATTVTINGTEKPFAAKKRV